MKQKKYIVWFRADLRLADNPALYHAAKQGSVIPIYILDQEGAGDFKLGDASRWWLHHSLLSLSDSLHGALRVYKGVSISILKKLIKEYDVDGIYWNNCYEPWMLQRDKKIAQELLDLGLDVQTFQSVLLWDPTKIVKSDGTSYKVFTAFLKQCLSQVDKLPNVLEKPAKKSFITTAHTTKIIDLKLLDHNSVQDRFQTYWQVGEHEAYKMLQHFIQHHLENYKIGRDFPAQEAVSKLSPYLHFGEISPLQVWYEIKNKGYEYASRENVQHFLKELIWREFAYNVLFHNPTVPRKNLYDTLNNFSWSYNKTDVLAWQLGNTGYPIIDAAMRELFNTGYMHNRIRMVVASFLIKNLMIHWHEGEDWFWQLLVDADLASNSFNWQWVAGCGYDAAPYFRIFNPILQAKKFDPQGKYIRRWLPELTALPDKYLFEPWKAPEFVLQEASIVLGKDYPYSIVDITVSRNRALDAYKKNKKNNKK